VHAIFVRARSAALSASLVALVASLCAGCALLGVGRVSVGLTATTQGTVGLAVEGDVAAGAVCIPERRAPADGAAVTAGMYLGGGATGDGWELETGERVEGVALDSDRELRAGVRAGAVLREARGPAVAFDLALGLARAGWWATERPSLGLELRAGPLIGVEDGARLEALRGFVGITYQVSAITRRYDPIRPLVRGLLEGPSGK
jgi:hypothetical protein